MQSPTTIQDLPAVAELLGLVGTRPLQGSSYGAVQAQFEARVLEAVKAHLSAERHKFAEAKEQARFHRQLDFDRSVTLTEDELSRQRDSVYRLFAQLHADNTVVEAGDKGLLPKQPTCFSLACAHVGVVVEPWVASVSQLDEEVAVRLSLLDMCKVHYTMYSEDDPRNHVVMVANHCKTARLDVELDGGHPKHNRVVAVTSMQEFFNKSGSLAKVRFYSRDGDGDLDDIADASTVAAEPTRDPRSAFGGGLVGGQQSRPQREQSVHDDTARSGGSNISGGVVRSRKRVVGAKGAVRIGPFIAKNYNVTQVTMFNNIDELFLDSISREYAQDIIDDLFSSWGLPTVEPNAMAYAEDLLWLFFIARTASNKADFNAAFEIPTSRGVVTVDFIVLSVMLAEKYGVTRRAFARGVSNDLRDYLTRQDNQFIISRIASRAGADPQMGKLCFDGSTHCTGLTTSELAFTKTLESRNLFERDDVIAEGASGRLFQGMSGGVRSVVPR